MPEGLRYLFSARPISQVGIDLLDIALVSFLVYRALKLLRGTRAMQMGIGLLVLAAIYVVGRWLGLVTLVTVLSTLLSSILLVVVVIFQNDLRRGLLRAGARPLFLGLTSADEAKVIEEIIAAVTELARLRHGAIICWERDANLDEFIVGAGTMLDAQISRELLVSIFIPVGENKLHDGAVILRNLRIAQAGAFFPMPEKHGIDKQFGSRHRAALGITSDTDAIAIVVSEERGTIMFCFQDNHVDNVSPEALRSLLRRYEQPGKRARNKSGPDSAAPRSSIAPLSVPPQPLIHSQPHSQPLPQPHSPPISQPQPTPLITLRTQPLAPLPTTRPITVRTVTSGSALLRTISEPPPGPVVTPVSRKSLPSPPIDPAIDPSVENGEEGPDQ